jgi:hypothetical protein
MKTRTDQPTDGLEWLRVIRRDLQREIGATPKERGTYYRAKEKKLRTRMYAGRSAAITAK